MPTNASLNIQSREYRGQLATFAFVAGMFFVNMNALRATIRPTTPNIALKRAAHTLHIHRNAYLCIDSPTRIYIIVYMKYLLSILLLGCSLTVSAQTEVPPTEQPPTIAASTDSLLSQPEQPTTRLPLLMRAPGFDGCQPWLYGSYAHSWALHEGFNAQLSMSLTAGWGKGAPKGVGFGQSAAFAYALPIGKKWSFAAGVYAQHLDWGAWQNTDAGIAAALGYHVNERISLYAYATKSFMPSETTRGMFGLPPYYDWTLRDRIGAMAEFKIGENAAVQVSIEHSSGPRFAPLPAPPHPAHQSLP